jgi:outer membrane lipoprotein-sorting protein
MRDALIKTVGIAGSLLLAATAGAIAQDGKAAQPAANPVTGSTPWTGTVTKDAAASAAAGEQKLDAKQAAAVAKVNAYFNALNNMQGSFNQTDPDLKKSRGKFYMKRPGKFRFDYGAAAKKTIVSDGVYLAIQDPDVPTPETYELDNTPFRLLLKSDVDRAREARILDAQETDDVVSVTLQDRSPDVPGKIQLMMTKKSGVELKEWLITDMQGLETRVELSDINRSDEINATLFQRENAAAKKLQ